MLNILQLSSLLILIIKMKLQNAASSDFFSIHTK